MTTTTTDLPTPESLRAELDQLLAVGRAKLARDRAVEQHWQQETERMERERRDAAFVPVMDAVYESLPDCWVMHIDWRKEHGHPVNWFAPGRTEHMIGVDLPGLAPIAVLMYQATAAGEWRVEDRRGQTPFLVGRYYRYSGEEEDVVGLTREVDWTEARDAATAMALAEESAAERATLQAECDGRNAARQEREAKRAPAPTLAERLAAVLAEFVRYHSPQGE